MSLHFVRTGLEAISLGEIESERAGSSEMEAAKEAEAGSPIRRRTSELHKSPFEELS